MTTLRAGRWRRRRQAGFSLTELAIVMIAAGFIVGTVWVAASKTWETYHVYRTMQQITKTAQNIREYYTNAQALPAGDITAALDSANIFPLEMRRNPTAGAGQTPIDHSFNDSISSGAAPANGSFHIAGIACPGKTAYTCFRVQLMGLSQAACVKVLQNLPYTDTELGIVQVGTTNMANATTIMTNPMDPVTATAWCAITTGNTNEADWDFKLRN